VLGVHDVTRLGICAPGTCEGRPLTHVDPSRLSPYFLVKGHFRSGYPLVGSKKYGPMEIMKR
jgi:hypothetical protein